MWSRPAAPTCRRADRSGHHDGRDDQRRAPRPRQARHRRGQRRPAAAWRRHSDPWRAGGRPLSGAHRVCRCARRFGAGARGTVRAGAGADALARRDGDAGPDPGPGRGPDGGHLDGGPVAAHRLAREIDAGFVWINEVGKHFLGAPYGVRQSGIGRDECWRDAVLHAGEECAREFPAGGGHERRVRLHHRRRRFGRLRAGQPPERAGGLPRAGAGGRPLGSRSADPRAAGLGQDPAEAVARLGLRRRAGRARRRPRDRVRARQGGGRQLVHQCHGLRARPSGRLRPLGARLWLDEWRFEDTLPYFRRLEDWEDARAPSGGGGPAQRCRYQDPLLDAFATAAGQAGHPWLEDYNARPTGGFALADVDPTGAAPRPPICGRRCGGRTCAWRPARMCWAWISTEIAPRGCAICAAAGSRRAGAARGHPRRRRDQHASHPDAFGHRAGASAGTGRPVGAAGPSRRGRQSAGPHLGHRDGAARAPVPSCASCGWTASAARWCAPTWAAKVSPATCRAGWWASCSPRAWTRPTCNSC